MKLRECPFCGGEAEAIEMTKRKYRIHGVAPVYIRCKMCGVSTSVKTTKEQAAYSWNCRFSDDPMERVEDDGK